MQHSSAAAKLIRQMFRQDSHHNQQDEMQVWLHRRQLSLQFCCEMLRSEPSWARRDPLRAVLGARRPVWRPSWARPEAILSARRPVRRPSWAPGEPSGGCLGRQEARPQVVLTVRRPECRFYCSFAAKCRFCAGGRQGAPSPKFQSRQA